MFDLVIIFFSFFLKKKKVLMIGHWPLYPCYGHSRSHMDIMYDVVVSEVETTIIKKVIILTKISYTHFNVI